MRHALAAGTFALLIAGSWAAARADTKTAHIQTGSPDVATWTSHFVRTDDGLNGFAARVVGRMPRIAAQLAHNARRFLGTPYVFGGTTPSGFDCSGFVQYLFARIGLHIPRTADAQYYAGKPISGALVPGDLVFFQTYTRGPSHVGIYLGNGVFIHSAGHAVRVSRLKESYYAARYLGAKRFLASR